jgi:hypothetical protein
LSVAAAIAMLVAPALPTIRVAEAGDWMPMLPDQDFYDFQLFAPPDLNEYGIWERDHDGIYFNYDRLYWGITIPRTVPVGATPTGQQIIPSQPISPFTVADLNNDYLEFAQTNPIIVQQTTGSATNTTSLENISSNTTLFEVGSDPLRLDLNTSWMRTKMTWGDRYEGGWSYGGRGVRLSYFQVGAQEQSFGTVNEFAANSPTQTFTFENSSSGGGAGAGGGGGTGGSAILNVSLETTVDSPPPDHIITQNLLQRNSTELQSAAVAMTLRRELGRERGSTQATFSLGPRFLQVAERYELDYVSFQNTFNTGGTGGTTGGTAGTTGGTGGTTGATGGTTGGTTGTTAGTTGGTTGGTGGLTTGPGGDVETVFTTSLGGAGALGITTGDLPSTMTGIGPGSLFQAADWEAYTSNNMVGPEFGLMLEGSQGRWDWYAGGSMTAGFNWQNNIYRGANLPQNTGADYLRTNFAGGGVTTIAFSAPSTGDSSVSTVTVPTSPLITQIFPTGQSNTTNSAEHRFVFSPIGEWRLGGKFRVSKSISLNFGYTGMWLSQIARASSNTSFATVTRLTARATSNQTATVSGGTVTDPGQTAVVNPNNALVRFVPNSTTTQLPDGFRYVTPTTVVGGTTVPNPEQYVQFNNSVYTQQVPSDGGNEYVFTNGIDFGLEVKF